jgi:hypothetical protein
MTRHKSATTRETDPLLERNQILLPHRILQRKKKGLRLSTAACSFAAEAALNV